MERQRRGEGKLEGIDEFVSAFDKMSVLSYANEDALALSDTASLLEKFVNGEYAMCGTSSYAEGRYEPAIRISD